MTLIIEALRGVWRAQVDSRTEFAETLEELLLKIAPDAPEEYVWHAAEVLGGVLGAEVVEVPANEIEIDWEKLAEQYLDDIGERADSWQPTEAQSAYFEPERTEEAESFDPDVQPRGV